MKKILSVLFVITGIIAACQDLPIGFLKTENAVYLPDSMVVRRNLDPSKMPDANIIKYDTEWVSVEIQGVMGTKPLMYSIHDVRVESAGDPALFKEQLKIIGGGRFYFPSKDIKAPSGRYVISVRVENEGYSTVLKDAFTMILE